MEPNHTPDIDAQFSQCISHLMELSEGLFGHHQHWAFYRKALLKRLNDLRRETLQLAARKGTEDGKQGFTA